MFRLAFEVPMVPVAKARARVTANGTYTPKRTRVAEKTVRDHATVTMGSRAPSDRPLALTARFLFPVPVSWPKWKRKDALEKRLLHTIRPDVENLGKLILDALIGVVYVDDSQVVTVTFHKDYGGVGRVEIEIAEVPLEVAR